MAKGAGRTVTTSNDGDSSEDLGKILSSLKKKDQIWRLSCHFTLLHAIQGRNEHLRPFSKQSIDRTDTTTHTEGIPSGENVTPKIRHRGRQQNTTNMIQSYEFEPTTRSFYEGPITKFDRFAKQVSIVHLQVGGPYGLLSKVMRDSIVAKGKEKYWMASASLISFHPVEPINELFPDYIEISKATTALEHRIEPRNKQGGGRTYVPVYHEFLFDPVNVDVHMIVNAECLRTTAEVGAILHMMQQMPFGAARSGQLLITDPKRIQ